MTAVPYTIDAARNEVCASGTAGAPFLLAFSLTLGATGIAGFWLDVRTIALMTMFQGNLALPLAFWLERRMSPFRMSPDNPLKSLSIQLAMSQLLALPVVILAYDLAPAAVPACMAGIGAAHFLPYAWVHRTRWYVVLAVVMGIVPFALTVIIGATAAPWVLMFMSATYILVAIPLRRHARALIMAER